MLESNGLIPHSPSKCPVCKNKIKENSTSCMDCGFTNFQYNFSCEEEKTNWETNEVEEYRANFVKNLCFIALGNGSFPKEWKDNELCIVTIHFETGQKILVPREFVERLPLNLLYEADLVYNFHGISLCINNHHIRIYKHLIEFDTYKKGVYKYFVCIDGEDGQYIKKIDKKVFYQFAEIIFKFGVAEQNICQWKYEDFNQNLFLNRSKKQLLYVAQNLAPFLMSLYFEDFGSYDFDGFRNKKFNTFLKKVVIPFLKKNLGGYWEFLEKEIKIDEGVNF